MVTPREIVSGVGNRRPGTMRGTLVSQPMERLAVLANRAYGVARQSCQVISAMKIALSEGGGVNEIAWACVGAGFAIIAFGVILRVMEIRLVSSIRAKLDARPTEDERVPPLDDERISASQEGERDLQLERAKNEARTKQLELDAVIRQGENEYRRQLASLAKAVASSPRAPQAFLIATLLFAFATAIVLVDLLSQ